MSLAMTATCQALQQILQLHLPGNLAAENAQLRAENARLRAENIQFRIEIMELEEDKIELEAEKETWEAEARQLRAEKMSPWRNPNAADGQQILLAWEEYAMEVKAYALTLTQNIDWAACKLQKAIDEVLVYMDEHTGTVRTRINDAHCSLVKIRKFLEEDEEMVQIRNFLEQQEQREEEGAEEAEEEDAEEDEQP